MALLVSCCTLFAQTSVSIAEGQEVSDSLAAKSTHSYALSLDFLQFVHGNVDQKTVDVVVKIFSQMPEK